MAEVIPPFMYLKHRPIAPQSQITKRIGCMRPLLDSDSIAEYQVLPRVKVARTPVERDRFKQTAFAKRADPVTEITDISAIPLTTTGTHTLVGFSGIARDAEAGMRGSRATCTAVAYRGTMSVAVPRETYLSVFGTAVMRHTPQCATLKTSSIKSIENDIVGTVIRHTKDEHATVVLHPLNCKALHLYQTMWCTHDLPTDLRRGAGWDAPRWLYQMSSGPLTHGEIPSLGRLLDTWCAVVCAGVNTATINATRAAMHAELNAVVADHRGELEREGGRPTAFYTLVGDIYNNRVQRMVITNPERACQRLLFLMLSMTSRPRELLPVAAPMAVIPWGKRRRAEGAVAVVHPDPIDEPVQVFRRKSRVRRRRSPPPSVGPLDGDECEAAPADV
jgi:hypothetical protein